MGLSLDRVSSLILMERFGKHTEALAQGLIANPAGKTAATVGFTDG